MGEGLTLAPRGTISGAMRVITRSPEDTAALGAAVGARLFDGAVVLLVGGLGAGKTCFTQGLARALGVDGPVQSPTFIVIQEYPDARVPLRHADLYRLDTFDEVRSTGLDERVGDDGAWVIEWADKFPEVWPPDRLEVHLSHEVDGRAVRFVATGPRHAALIP